MHIKKNTQSVLDIIIADHNLLFFWFVTYLFKNFHLFGSLGNVKISSNQLRRKRRYQETFWGLMRVQNGKKKRLTWIMTSEIQIPSRHPYYLTYFTASFFMRCSYLSLKAITSCEQTNEKNSWQFAIFVLYRYYLPTWKVNFLEKLLILM